MRQLIEGWEGCRLEPYADAVGVATIGYGHCGDDVSLDMDPITQEIADQLLAADLGRFETAVNGMVSDQTQQQQFGRWNHAGGRVLPGLTRRRAGEAAVYATGDYSGDAGQPSA